MKTDIEKEKSQESLRVGVLASGEQVYDRPNGHIHESIKEDLPLALAKIYTEGRDSIVDTVTLEGKTWKLLKIPINPLKDSENLFLARRRSRAGLSTFIKNAKPGTTDKMVVILSKNNKSPENNDGYTVISSFAGDLAPREPWDAYFNGGSTDEERTKRRKEKEESLEYWSCHAFIPDENEFPIDPGTEQKYKQEALKNPFLTVEEKEKKVVYTGLFVVNIDELVTLCPPRHKKVFAHHSTIEFMPKDSNNLEMGKHQQLKIIGRAYDEKGDALLVENFKSKNKYPHITLSCAEGVPAQYSNELLEKAAQNGSIEYFSEPIFIDVVEGFENGSKKVITEDKYLISNAR